MDIGGTKIAAGVFDDSGALIERFRRDTPRTGSGADVMTAVVELLGQVRQKYPFAAVGLGAKGAISDDGVVLHDGDTLPGWSGTDVAGPIRAAFDVSVAVQNDVRVTTLAEARRGAGRGYPRMLLAALGTGVGGGLIIDERLLLGRHGTAGEIAHLLVNTRGAIPCGCGRFDHLEAVCAGPAIEAEYVRRSGADPDIELPEIAERMRAGDEIARATITDAARVLGAALAGLATAVDVDVLVIGGGVAQIGADFLDPAIAEFRAAALQPIKQIPVLPAALGTDAPLVGAAELVTEV